MKISLKLVLSLFFGAIIFSSCSQERKLQKAVETVLVNADARHQVFLNELERFPCSTDSSIEYIPGAIDSMTYAEYLKFLNGELQDPGNLPDSSLSSQDAYERGFLDAKNVYLNKKVRVCKPDTIRIKYTDHQYEDVLKKTINDLNLQAAEFRGQIAEKDKRIKESNSKSAKLMWLLVLPWVVIAGAMFMKFRGKIKL